MPDRSRRKALRDVAPNPTTHAGLWLDRFLERQTDAAGKTSDLAKEARSNLVRQIDEGLKVPPDYHAFAFRRLTALLSPGVGRCVAWRIFRSVGRVVVGLGQQGVVENGITLERTWGVPVLPGPSLKGVAAATAHKLIEDPEWHKSGGDDGGPGRSAAQLFGTTERAGCVSFFDALWLPQDGSTSNGLHADIITVHNRAYYQGTFSSPSRPDGTCSPIPVSFLSASGDFLVAVECAEEDADWARSALQLLEYGLLHLGIGAKTNAGYGRLKCLDDNHGTAQAIRERIEKAERAAELQGADPREILGAILSAMFQSASACKHFASAIDPVARDGSRIALADLVSGEEATQHLANIAHQNMTPEAQTQLLREVIRSHPATQSWPQGRPEGSRLNKGNGFFKAVAKWAGITSDEPAAETSATATPPPATALERHYPKASALPTPEREALEALVRDDGSCDEEMLLEVMDRVAEEDWSPEARRIVTSLMEKIG